MRRINDNEIAITEEELYAIQSFIRGTLYDQWDKYTDNVCSTRTLEEGMRSMNPGMYDFCNSSYLI